MKVSQVRQMLANYKDDDHIVIAWWDKDLFQTLDDDLKEHPLEEEVWVEANEQIDHDGDLVFGDYTNSTIHDAIAEVIAKVHAERD